jgi:hypothetical protein
MNIEYLIHHRRGFGIQQETLKQGASYGFSILFLNMIFHLLSGFDNLAIERGDQNES